MSPLDKPTRREFLVTTSSAALGAGPAVYQSLLSGDALVRHGGRLGQ